MSKIICDVCGTSFPEESSQCPVCGCIPLADAQRVADEVTTEEETAGYTQVRGGRYAQNNVRKRERSSASRPFSREDKPDKILLITAAILLLIIIIAVIVIAVEIFTPDAPEPTTPSTEPSSPSVSYIDCTGLTLNINSIAFEEAGATKTLIATATPADTDDIIVFRSENTAVATVSETGVITAVAEGATKIIITCGDVVRECMIICDFPDPMLGTISFNTNDFTLAFMGAKHTLYNGDVDVSFIRWRSDNEAIATIKDGVVEAVGGGTTIVYAEYGDQIISCIVRCAFSGGNSGVTPDVPTYKIYTQWGNQTTDVSITVGEVVKLTLKDESGNAVDVSLVTWTCADSNVTISGNVITGAAAGTTTVTAVYEGVTYKCIFRVYN